MNKVLISEQLSPVIEDSLREQGYNVIKIRGYNRLDMPVMSHVDMLLYKIDDCELLTFREYHEQNIDLFNTFDCKIVTCEILPRKEYPYDIALNALRIDKTVFGREEYLAKEILINADKLVNVKQGYAKCSSLYISPHLIITADSSISYNCRNEGISVLEISPGSIGIESYEYGFIGGASFTHDNNVYFFGDIYKHPDGDKIVKAIIDCGKNVYCLSDDQLFDYGGAIVI